MVSQRKCLPTHKNHDESASLRNGHPALTIDQLTISVSAVGPAHVLGTSWKMSSAVGIGICIGVEGRNIADEP